LQGNFLPSGTIKNPWGQTFSVGANTTGTSPGSEFSVCTTIIGQQAYSAATVIAGRLPMASAIDGTVSCPTASTTACTAGSSTCTVVSSVNIPGQNLNNARSINFAGLYHNSACVPAPVCPSNMIPSIMAVPVSVSGMNDGISTVYPISSFTAYVRGADANGNPGQFPASCSDASSYPACYADMPPPPTPYTGLPTGKYWRVCLRIITEKGLLTYSSTTKDAGIVLVLTRCSPANEYTTPSVYGSKFTVFWP
jgi:hypothetical protein